MALTVEPTVVPYVPILYSFSRVSLHQPDVVANRELAVQLHTGKGFFSLSPSMMGSVYIPFLKNKTLRFSSTT